MVFFLLALAAFGRGLFACFGAVACSAPIAVGGEGGAAYGADGGRFVGCAAKDGLAALALLAAVAGGMAGGEGAAAVEAVQAVDMARS